MLVPSPGLVFTTWETIEDSEGASGAVGKSTVIN